MVFGAVIAQKKSANWHEICDAQDDSSSCFLQNGILASDNEPTTNPWMVRWSRLVFEKSCYLSRFRDKIPIRPIYRSLSLNRGWLVGNHHQPTRAKVPLRSDSRVETLAFTSFFWAHSTSTFC